MDSDGFTVVKNRKQKKGGPARRFLSRKNIENVSNTLLIGSLNIENREELLNQIEKCIEELDLYLKRFESALERIPKNEFHQVICFGLGNFTRSTTSLYQFSLLYHLKFNRSIAPSYSIFDPAFTPFEIDVLKSMDFTVLTDNHQCRYPITVPTLFYMPHMYSFHYCNLLESNKEHLENIVLFGNDMSFYINTLGRDQESESLIHFLNHHPVVNQENIPADLFRFTDVFSDQAIQTFNPTHKTTNLDHT